MDSRAAFDGLPFPQRITYPGGQDIPTRRLITCLVAAQGEHLLHNNRTNKDNAFGNYSISSEREKSKRGHWRLYDSIFSASLIARRSLGGRRRRRPFASMLSFRQRMR